jgi:cell division transport system permease protein
MVITAVKFMSRLGYLIKEGFRSVFTHGFMSFASVTIIIACLLIMGSFALLAVNIDALIDRLEKENEMLAFVDESLSESKAKALQPEIEAVDNVSKVEFVTRDKAMESFTEDYENKSMFEDIDSSVFRHRFVIYLDDIALMKETKQALEQLDGIDSVSAQLDISKGFVTVRNVVSAVSLILIVILFIVSVFIMSNTIKLTTFGRREEIAIMKMVGATNSFIRTPFVVEGLFLGITGSLLAFLIQWGLYELVGGKIMTSIAGTLIGVLPFSAVALPVALIFLAVGFVVGTFGGSIAIRNYMKV